MSPFRSLAKFSSDMHIPSSSLSQPRPHSLRAFRSDWKAIHHAVLDATTLAKSAPRNDLRLGFSLQAEACRLPARGPMDNPGSEAASSAD
jgi:hypothetical protein